MYLSGLNSPVLYLEEGGSSTGAWVRVPDDLARLTEVNAAVFLTSCNDNSGIPVEGTCFDARW
jgi:hypothetical protein